jgi:hypothetical protein
MSMSRVSQHTRHMDSHAGTCLDSIEASVVLLEYLGQLYRVHIVHDEVAGSSCDLSHEGLQDVSQMQKELTMHIILWCKAGFEHLVQFQG